MLKMRIHATTTNNKNAAIVKALFESIKDPTEGVIATELLLMEFIIVFLLK